MNCDGVRELLSAYVDGELSPGELLRVEQHLRRCHACADEVDSLRQAVALVASLDEVEVPPSFHVQLHERLVALGPSVSDRRRAAIASRPGPVRRWMVPAAAAAAALAIGITTYGQIGRLPLTGFGSTPGQQVAENPPAPATPTVTSSQPNAAASGGNTSGPTPVQSPPPVTPQTGITDQSGSAGTGPQQAPAQPSGGSKPAVGGTAMAPAAGTGTAPGDTTANPNLATVATEQSGSGTALASLPPVYHYSAIVTVPADSAAVVTAAVQSQFPGAALENESITLDVPAGSYEPALAAITKMAPDITVAKSQQDYAQSIKLSEIVVAGVKANQAKLANTTGLDPKAEAAQQQALANNLAAAQENLNALYRLRDQATIIINFQAASQ